MHARFSLLFLLLLGPKAVFAHDTPTQWCETRLQLESASFKKLGYKPTFQLEQLEPFSKNHGLTRYRISARHPRFAMSLAFIDFSLSKDGRILEVEKIDVLNANNYRKGLSNLLFLETLEQRPQVTTIVATLGDMNRTTLNAAMRRGQTCIEAFVATPLYQTASHFGFTNFTADCNSITLGYKFVMTRGEVH